MDFTVSTADFLAAAKVTMKASSTTPILPVLGFMVIDAYKGSVVLTATTLDVWVNRSIENVTVTESGRVLVPAAKLVKLLTALVAETVRVQETSKGVVVSAGKSKYTLPVMPVEEYPNVPDQGKAVAEFEAPVKIVDVFTEAAQFCSTESSRGSMQAFRVRMTGKHTLTVESTDGHQLYHREIKVPGVPDGMVMHIPGPAAPILALIAAGGGEPISFRVEDHILTATTPHTSVMVKLSPDSLPPVEKFVEMNPIDGSFTIVSAHTLINGLRAMAVMAPDSGFLRMTVRAPATVEAPKGKGRSKKKDAAPVQAAMVGDVVELYTINAVTVTEGFEELETRDVSLSAGESRAINIHYLMAAVRAIEDAGPTGGIEIGWAKVVWRISAVESPGAPKFWIASLRDFD